MDYHLCRETNQGLACPTDGSGVNTILSGTVAVKDFYLSPGYLNGQGVAVVRIGVFSGKGRQRSGVHHLSAHGDHAGQRTVGVCLGTVKEHGYEYAKQYDGNNDQTVPGSGACFSG
jgi:hypothetical protein